MNKIITMASKPWAYLRFGCRNLNSLISPFFVPNDNDVVTFEIYYIESSLQIRRHFRRQNEREIGPRGLQTEQQRQLLLFTEKKTEKGILLRCNNNTGNCCSFHFPFPVISHITYKQKAIHIRRKGGEK